MSIADDTIISVMGTVATVTSGVLAGTSLTGVFDDPESVSYVSGGVRIEGVSPSFFVKSSALRQLKRADTLVIGEQNYWVDRMEWKRVAEAGLSGWERETHRQIPGEGKEDVCHLKAWKMPYRI